MTGDSGYCHLCRRATITVLRELSSGHIGRLCSQCGTARKGRPYATRRQYQQTLVDATLGQGQQDEQE